MFGASFSEAQCDRTLGAARGPGRAAPAAARRARAGLRALRVLVRLNAGGGAILHSVSSALSSAAAHRDFLYGTERGEMRRQHRPPLEPEIHRVDPEFGSTLRLLYRDSQSNCWVNLRILGQPCEFYL
jgi:hypothetical protein